MRTSLVAAVVMLATTGRAVADDVTPTIEEAFPPTLRFTESWQARIDRIDADRGEHGLLWVTVHVTTPRFVRGGGEGVTVPIDVPTTARILGIQVANDTSVLWGQALGVEHATARYTHSVHAALLAWQSTSANADIAHLELHLDSVGEGGATITLLLEPAVAMNLHVEPAKLARVAGKPLRAPIALFPGAEPTAGRSVDEHTSIVVGEPPPIAAGGMSEMLMRGSLDKAMIRRRVKSHLKVLQHCYELELQKHPRLAGHADLHFTIAEDGYVTEASVDGELPNAAVKACMAGEVATWTFPPVVDGGATGVNYPIDLVVAR